MTTSSKFAGDPQGTPEGADFYCDLYRQMVLIRRFEEAIQSLFLRGEVYGSTHLCVGQEAIATGMASMVQPQDWVAATYRGHGHALALGTDPQQLLEELLGRKNGICGGRAGSMNFVDLKHRLIGCFAIVGGSIAAATGAALTLSRRNEGGVGVAFFGDGAANQAYFFECLNFAKVFSLPAVYVCENNQYGEYTPTDTVTPGGIAPRAAAMGISALSVDGMDLWTVRDAAQTALESARSGKGPIFIEAETYRYSDHGRGDPVQYRPDGEMERWKERDPLLIARNRLMSEFDVSEEELNSLHAEVEEELGGVQKAALEAPFPDPALSASEFKS